MLRSRATTPLRRLTRGAATDATSVYFPSLLRFGGGCSTTLPAAHECPSGQLAQSAALVRLVALPYLPLSQSRATDAPSVQ